MVPAPGSLASASSPSCCSVTSYEGEAEAGCFHLRVKGENLSERFERDGDHLRRHADAGIPHAEDERISGSISTATSTLPPPG